MELGERVSCKIDYVKWPKDKRNSYGLAILDNCITTLLLHFKAERWPGEICLMLQLDDAIQRGGVLRYILREVTGTPNDWGHRNW